MLPAMTWCMEGFSQTLLWCTTDYSGSVYRVAWTFLQCRRGRLYLSTL